jgi:hypothetical protein
MMNSNLEFPDSFHAVVVVWGEEYISRFLDVTLPCLMAQGNVPALHAAAPFTFHLYAFTDEVEMIFSVHPLWQAFAAKFKINHVPLEKLWVTNEACMNDRYLNMMAAHNHFGHAVSRDKRAAMLYLSPDVLYSGTFFSFLVRKLREGYRVVMCNGLRVIRKTAVELLKEVPQAADGSISLPPADVISLFRKAEHPMFKLRYVGKGKIAVNTSLWIWEDEQRNAVLRSFHWLPVVAWPQCDFDYLKNPATIDTHYGQSVSDGARVYFQEDMLDFIHLDLADEQLVDGDEVFDTGADLRAYSSKYVRFLCRFDVRVITNILQPTLIPNMETNSPDRAALARLVADSLAQSEHMLDCITHGIYSGIANATASLQHESLLTALAQVEGTLNALKTSIQTTAVKKTKAHESWLKAKLRSIEQSFRQWRRYLICSKCRERDAKCRLGQ